MLIRMLNLAACQSTRVLDVFVPALVYMLVLKIFKRVIVLWNHLDYFKYALKKRISTEIGLAIYIYESACVLVSQAQSHIFAQLL
jgi:hypothetical protein